MNSSMSHNQVQLNRINQEAAQWFARLNSAARSIETERAFQEWLAADVEHVRAYEQCKSIWLLSDDLATDSDIQQELALARQDAYGADAQQRNRWHRYAQYAAIAFVAVALVFVGTQMPSNEYSTKVGEQRLIKLADGSTAMLNTNTVVKVYISDTRRQIELQQGEAYFNVAHDSAHPFEVLAAGNIVRALGTEFNVTVDDREIAVSVAKGRVAVETESLFKPRHIVAEINPGEAVTYRKNDQPPLIEVANLERITAWQSRKIYFKAARLQDAIKEYNRYIEQSIQLVDEDLSNQLITGIFNVGDTDSFLFTLEQALGAHIIKDKNRILIMKPRTLAGENARRAEG